MIRTSAPGSIMITGEHAVVYGHRAIVAAIEQRIFVTLQPRPDRQIHIASEIAPTLVTDLENLAQGGPYRFILAALALHVDTLKTGFDMQITSEIDPTLGLGSSAAVTIACLGAISTFAEIPTDALHANAYQIIQDIQGRGSGADLAASLKGGMIGYRAPPEAEIFALPMPPALSLKYCGYKTPTADVLATIAERMQGREAEFNTLYIDMGALADHAIGATKASDWSAFAKALTQYQEKMQALGVCDDVLGSIIAQAIPQTGVMAAKISGSGLGDCVLAMGTPPAGFVPIVLAKEGLKIHG